MSEKEANGLTYVRGIFGGVTPLLKLERGRDETGAHLARHLLLLLLGALWVALTVIAGNCQGKKKATIGYCPVALLSSSVPYVTQRQRHLQI